MRAYFISDTHLKPVPKTAEDAARQKKVVQFLEKITGKADILVIAGDFFDLWFDWKNIVLSQFFPVYCALRDLRKGGCQIKIVAGNHDFYFRYFLQNQLGIEVHKAEISLQIDNRKIFVTHGDSHGKNDFRYKFYKLLIRSKIFELFFGTIPPALSIQIGSFASRSSRFRKVDPKKLARKEEQLLQFAKKKIAEDGYDIVVMGHTHNPLLQKISGGIYANCGDWLTHDSYLELCDGELKLKIPQ